MVAIRCSVTSQKGWTLLITSRAGILFGGWLCMKDKFHHRGHRESTRNRQSNSQYSPCPPCLRGKYFFATLISISLVFSTTARTRHSPAPLERNHYQIKLALDFENRTYTGSEVVRFVNRGERPATSLFFHLYPNIRVPGYAPPTDKRGEPGQGSDEPRQQIIEVRAANGGPPLLFDLDDQETTLRVGLREPVMPKAVVEIEIKYKGSVPETDSEET